MPTVFTHPAVPLAIGLGLGRKTVSKRLLIIGAVGSMVPDLDVVAFQFGIPYESDYGHRGFTHSLLFAVGLALFGACFFRWLRTGFFRSFLFVFVAAASHGLLDALTNGGLGIALCWPWTGQRYFAPFQPIEVSPLSVSGFLSGRGIEVLTSELFWVWLPAMAIALSMKAVRLVLARRPDVFRPDRNRH